MSSAHLDHQPPTELKVVLLGDAGVGKSALVSTFVTGSYPEQPPLTANFYSAVHSVDGLLYALTIVDTQGGPEHDELRYLWYQGTDCFVLCYSIADPSSLERVRSKWHPERVLHAPGTPAVLVGLQLDRRFGHHESRSEFHHRFTDNDERVPVSRAEGEALAEAIAAVALVESSAQLSKHVSDVFDAAVRSAAVPPGRNRRKCTIS